MPTRVYIDPVFNLVGDFWANPHKPSGGPADVVGISVQKYVNSLIQAITEPQLRIPPLSVPVMTVGDIWEVPQGSGRYWKALAQGSVHEGFPNEYWCVLVVQVDATGAQVLHYP